MTAFLMTFFGFLASPMVIVTNSIPAKEKKTIGKAEGILAFWQKGEAAGEVAEASVTNRSFSIRGNHDDPGYDQGDDGDDLDHGKPEFSFAKKLGRRQVEQGQEA